MKYKVGDKVKVMFKESWSEEAKRDVKRLLNQIATIESVHPGQDYEYFMEGMHWGWREDEIIKLVEREEITRFELMDME